MATISIEGGRLGTGIGYGIVRVEQKHGAVHVWGDIRPQMAEAIGPHVHVAVTSDNQGNCLEKNPITHKQEVISSKVFEATDVIVERGGFSNFKATVLRHLGK